jgi:hypothetical protein
MASPTVLMGQEEKEMDMDHASLSQVVETVA